MTTIGLLNPGEMGSMVGAAVRSGGSRVLWAGEGRSAATRKRATDAGLEDAGSLAALVRASEVIVSVCPPAAAAEQAEQVAKLRFAGTYVDGNAVSPATAREIGGLLEKGGATGREGQLPQGVAVHRRDGGDRGDVRSGRAARRLPQGRRRDLPADGDLQGGPGALVRRRATRAHAAAPGLNALFHLLERPGPVLLEEA